MKNDDYTTDEQGNEKLKRKDDKEFKDEETEAAGDTSKEVEKLNSLVSEATARDEKQLLETEVAGDTSKEVEKLNSLISEATARDEKQLLETEAAGDTSKEVKKLNLLVSEVNARFEDKKTEVTGDASREVKKLNLLVSEANAKLKDEETEVAGDTSKEVKKLNLLVSEANAKLKDEDKSNSLPVPEAINESIAVAAVESLFAEAMDETSNDNSPLCDLLRNYTQAIHKTAKLKVNIGNGDIIRMIAVLSNPFRNDNELTIIKESAIQRGTPENESENEEEVKEDEDDTVNEMIKTEVDAETYEDTSITAEAKAMDVEVNDDVKDTTLETVHSQQPEEDSQDDMLETVQKTQQQAVVTKAMAETAAAMKETVEEEEHMAKESMNNKHELENAIRTNEELIATVNDMSINYNINIMADSIKIATINNQNTLDSNGDAKMVEMTMSDADGNETYQNEQKKKEDNDVYEDYEESARNKEAEISGIKNDDDQIATVISASPNLDEDKSDTWEPGDLTEEEEHLTKEVNNEHELENAIRTNEELIATVSDMSINNNINIMADSMKISTMNNQNTLDNIGDGKMVEMMMSDADGNETYQDEQMKEEDNDVYEDYEESARNEEAKTMTDKKEDGKMATEMPTRSKFDEDKSNTWEPGDSTKGERGSSDTSL
jgi:hypothetical protein